MLPNKPRGVPRVNDRRVLNGIFWVLRSGAPWRDLPEAFGPYTTCYNRFVRWRRAGVWSRIIDALAAAHDGAVQMIDTSIVRVHPQQGRTVLQPDQAMPPGRDTLRQTRRQLPCLRPACIDPALAGRALMSPRPSFAGREKQAKNHS